MDLTLDHKKCLITVIFASGLLQTCAGAASTFPPFSPVTCPPDFTSFAGHCISYIEDPLAYQDARSNCSLNSSHILFAKQEWMWTYSEYFIGSKLPTYWVGLSYNQASGQFEWADGTIYNSATDWTGWCAGQPGTPGQWAGNCVATKRDYQSGHYCWYMTPCTQPLHTVCMLDDATTTGPTWFTIPSTETTTISTPTSSSTTTTTTLSSTSTTTTVPTTSSSTTTTTVPITTSSSTSTTIPTTSTTSTTSTTLVTSTSSSSTTTTTTPVTTSSTSTSPIPTTPSSSSSTPFPTTTMTTESPTTSTTTPIQTKQMTTVPGSSSSMSTPTTTTATTATATSTSTTTTTSTPTSIRTSPPSSAAAMTTTSTTAASATTTTTTPMMTTSTSTSTIPTTRTSTTTVMTPTTTTTSSTSASRTTQSTTVPSSTTSPPACKQKVTANFLPLMTSGRLTSQALQMMQNETSSDCALSCIKYSQCASFDWNIQTGECSLHTEKYAQECDGFIPDENYQHYELVTTDKQCQC